MNDNLRELYQEIILEHSKCPRNFGDINNPTSCANGHNRMCGDKLIVCLQLDENKLIKDISFKGTGCAISIASASLMTEIVKGKSVTEAEAIFKNFHKMVTGDKSTIKHCSVNEMQKDKQPAIDIDFDITQERLKALSGVKNFPTRVKCATLAWHTMDAAIKKDYKDISTE